MGRCRRCSDDNDVCLSQTAAPKVLQRPGGGGRPLKTGRKIRQQLLLSGACTCRRRVGRTAVELWGGGDDRCACVHVFGKRQTVTRAPTGVRIEGSLGCPVTESDVRLHLIPFSAPNFNAHYNSCFARKTVRSRLVTITTSVTESIGQTRVIHIVWSVRGQSCRYF